MLISNALSLVSATSSSARRDWRPLLPAAGVILLLASAAGCAGEAPPEPEPAEPSAAPEGEPSAAPEGNPEANEPEANEPEANEPEPAPEPECGANEQSATCDGADTIVVCNQGDVSSFSCDALCQQDGAPGGSCGPGPSGADCFCGEDPGPAFSHGDLCAPDTSGACGFPSSGLLCVVENQGDTQGVCRLVCTQNECLFDDDTVNALDTECCDVFNGSRVCANDQVYPDACGG